MLSESMNEINRPVTRNEIHIINRHSNLSENQVGKLLNDEIYSDAKSWKKFLQVLFISLGVGFTVSGIVFFFAYNWTDLHKFTKLGLVEGLIVISTLFVLFSKLNENAKNIILTGNAVLVGVLIAVFGQIYQTGANAYDFFLGWTAFISLWVIVSNYPALWLIYIILANTTFILYSQQVASDWNEVFIFNMLYIFNSVILLISLLISKLQNQIKIPSWFTSIIVLAVVSFSTIGICLGVFGSLHSSFLILLALTGIGYGAGIIYGLKMKSALYLSIIPFSVVIIISAVLLNMSDGAGMFFLVGFFIIGSVTLLIKSLIDIQKKWNNE